MGLRPHETLRREKVMAKKFHLAERECVAEAIAAADRAQSLPELYAEMEAYEGHDVAKREDYTPSQMVDHESPIMIVTEKPEPEDRIEGKPFSGEYGRIMRNTAKTIGVDLDSCHIAYAVRWLPDEEKSPNKTQIAASRPFIYKEIELVKPRVLLVQGRGAIESLASYRGNVLDIYGQTMNFSHNDINLQMFMTAHPKYCLFNGTYFATFNENNKEFFERYGTEEERTYPGSYEEEVEEIDWSTPIFSRVA